jgi:hypothetical protein
MNDAAETEFLPKRGMRRESFDDLAQSIAETVDAILYAHRDRSRRIALIRHQVRHALSIGFRAGIRRVDRHEKFR